ncbi:MAG: ComF family protein [Patescibacteria group bacterium]
MFEDIGQIKGWLEDLLFPKSCVNCRQEKSWLCGECTKLLKAVAMNLGSHVFDSGNHLEKLWALTDYNDLLAQKVIQAIKYNFIKELVCSFDSLIVEMEKIIPAWSREFVLLPVPLHQKRLSYRGFNQAELISERISRLLGNPLGDKILKRKIYTRPQVGLSQAKRRENIKGSFLLDNKVEWRFPRNNVVLIDDVYTTGATMGECAEVLQKAGFTNIKGLVIAHG